MADILVGKRKEMGRGKEFNSYSDPFYRRRQKEACPRVGRVYSVQNFG